MTVHIRIKPDETQIRKPDEMEILHPASIKVEFWFKDGTYRTTIDINDLCKLWDEENPE